MMFWCIFLGAYEQKSVTSCFIINQGLVSIWIRTAIDTHCCMSACLKLMAGINSEIKRPKTHDYHAGKLCLNHNSLLSLSLSGLAVAWKHKHSFHAQEKGVMFRERFEFDQILDNLWAWISGL